MKRTRRFPGRLLRWTSLCVCLALVLVSLVPLPLVSSKVSIALAQGQKITPPPPQKGAPFPNLPNLDLIKRQLPVQPEAPAAIPSTMRSRYRPLKGRNGLKVGDPGTTSGAVATTSSPRSSAKTSASSAVTSSSSSQSRFHHSNKSAIRNSKSAIPSSPPPVGDDQFIQNFFSYALSRTPTGGEQTYWDDVVRAAYPQGTNAVLLGARELGMTLFESVEYAARNRSDTDYVYDLYWTYLMRYHDYGGWQFWTSQVPSMGRENVRHAFDESTEFINLIATIAPNGSVTGNQTSLSSARVDPNNESGNQLLARDCEWSVGIFSLPGRSGLDLGLGLSYSSAAVWTRSGPSDHPYLYFDEDRGWPSPGFRLGLPVIQLPYFDAQAARSIYMLTTSAGQRMELRQVGTSNVYETADSSHLQLTDNGSTLLLRTTDGTQMTYQRFENEWKVTTIKDRNGNYLSVSYNAQGTSGQYDIHTITDTLNRTITFIYDGYNNVTSITQTWSGTTHTWATFSWGSNLTMDTTGFSGINVVGTHNGESIPVLRQVSLDDGSYYTFDYSGAALVTTIHRYTSDNVQRAYTAYNYDRSNSDCPRITASRVWADPWTGLNGLLSELTKQFGVGCH